MVSMFVSARGGKCMTGSNPFFLL